MNKTSFCIVALLLCALLSSVCHAAVCTDPATQPSGLVPIRSDIAPDPVVEAALRQAGYEVIVVPTSESNWDKVSKFNIWIICDWSPDQVNQAALNQFLQAGGGVFAAIWGSDTSSNILLKWNNLLSQYGITLMRELVLDRSHEWTQPKWNRTYAWTNNYAAHPITTGLSQVWYPDHPLNLAGHKVSTCNSVLDANWTPVVRAMSTGGAYALKADGNPDMNNMTQPQAPILSAREVGTGRLAVQAFPGFYNYSGGSTIMTDNIVLQNGDGTTPSDGINLLINTFNWLSEPSRASGSLGGYVREQPMPTEAWPGPPITLTQWEWMRPRVDDINEAIPTSLHHFKGLMGAHTSLSNGSGTVAEHCQAAQQAGYDFIIFAEELGSMNADKYNQLIAACNSASTNTFYAIPGLDVRVSPFSDPNAGEWKRILIGIAQFPDSSYLSPDGQVFANQFENWYFQNNYPGTAIHSMSQRGLPAWFDAQYNCFSVFTYRAGALIDDSETQFLRYMDNGTAVMPVVTHLCFSVADIQQAAAAPYQFYVTVDKPQNETTTQYRDALYSVKDTLNFSGGKPFRYPDPVYVSSGPKLEEYRMVGGSPFDLMYLDRIRLVVGVSSTNTLRNVSIYDGERPYRTVNSANTHARIAIEDYSSRYWHFIVKAEDVAGRRLISSSIADASWHIWARMCGDQQNIIAGMHLYFKGHSTLSRVPDVPPNNVRFWAGEGDDGPGNSEWQMMLSADVDENGGLPALEQYAPPEFHLDLATPFAVVVDANQAWKGGRAQTNMAPADPVRLDIRTYDFWPAVPSCTGSFAKNFPDYQKPHPPKVNWALIEGEAVLTRDVSPRTSVLPNLRLFGVKGDAADTCAYTPAGSSELVIVDKPAGGWSTTGELANKGMIIMSPCTIGSFCLYSLTPGLAFSLDRNSSGWALTLGYHLTGPAQAGQSFPIRFAVAKGIPGKTVQEDIDAFTWFGQQFALTGGSPFYQMTAVLQGSVVDNTRGLLELQAQDYGFLSVIQDTDKVRETVGVRVSGLNKLWDAGAYVPERQWLRRIGFVDDIGYTSLDQTEPKATFYIGNLLVCDNSQIGLRLVDATADWCRFIATNSTGAQATVNVSPASGFTRVYSIPSFTRSVTIPAGSSVTVDIGTRPTGKPWEHVYHVAELQYTVGTVMASDSGARGVQVRLARVQYDAAGYMAWEQWSTDEPAGLLSVIYRLKLAQVGGSDAVVNLYVKDKTLNQTLAALTLKGSDFVADNTYQDFTLNFSRPTTGNMAYEVYFTDKKDLYLDTITVRQP